MISLFLKIKAWVGEVITVRNALFLGVILFLLLAPNISDAFFLTDISGYFLSKVWFGISWLIALVAGLIIGVLIFALQMILMISNGIVNSSPVQIAYPIVLSVANLGFVTAVIVISIATILRNQTYGIKQLLTRVVVMAVMVNFGLVISGAILGFSNKITDYFLNSMTGGNVAEFATIMAQTLNPQKSFLEMQAPVATTTKVDGEVPVSEVDQDVLKAIGGAATDKDKAGYGALLMPIVSTLLTIVTLVIMIITLAILIVSFLVRYIKITFYLILLPIAWMSSIFPALKSWNGKWWNNFIQQVFYPPVVIFFLWLAMRVQAGMAQNDSLRFEIPEAGGLAGFVGNIVGIPLQGLLQAAVLAGLMLGGDYAGKALGVAGAGAATKTAMGMKGWAQGKVKTGLRRAGVGSIDAARNVGSSRVGKAVSNSAIGRLGAKISTLPIAGDLARIGGNTINRYATRAQEKMGASVSKSYKDDVSKMGDDELKVRAKAATGLELAAILDKASKDPKLMASILKNIPDANKKFMAGEEDLYKRYGYGKAHEAAMLESGMIVDSKHKTLEDARAENKKVADDPKSTDEQRTKANDDLIAAEKGFTEAIKKISADGANNLLFGKDKDGNFTLPETQRKDIMQSLIGNRGWAPGRFNEFLQKAADAGNDSDISKLFVGMAAERTNPAIIKALENGAMKNIGIDGGFVLGKELFDQAKVHHEIGDEAKQAKKIKEEIERNPNQSIEDAKKEGGGTKKESSGKIII